MTDDLELRLTELLERRARVSPATLAATVAALDRLPERRRSRLPLPLLAVAAVVVVAVVGLVLASLLRVPPDVAAPSVPARSVTPSTTLQARPVWAIDLASHLACAGPPSTAGRDITSDSAVSAEGHPTPDAAFDAIRSRFPDLPARGYTAVLVDDHWALQRLLVGSLPKVHIIATDQLPGLPEGSGWRVVGIRMCDPSEFSDAPRGSAS
jgi:hypothetical protein